MGQTPRCTGDKQRLWDSHLRNGKRNRFFLVSSVLSPQSVVNILGTPLGTDIPTCHIIQPSCRAATKQYWPMHSMQEMSAVSYSLPLNRDLRLQSQNVVIISTLVPTQRGLPPVSAPKIHVQPRGETRFSGLDAAGAMLSISNTPLPIAQPLP